jgi:hypothetical protein
VLVVAPTDVVKRLVSKIKAAKAAVNRGKRGVDNIKLNLSVKNLVVAITSSWLEF